MNTKAKKSLGQNFLSDRNVLEIIVLFAGIAPGDQVLEIGPGRGALTEHLLIAGATVTALELDDDLLPILRERFAKYKNFSLKAGDILQLPTRDFFSEGSGYKVVANIPYYITAPIIRKLLTEEPSPKEITLLVQKEVAERLAGGSKQRSILTVAAQFYSDVSLGPVIPKEYFDPIPKVESQLVKLIPKRKSANTDSDFFRIVKAGFAARRKTLFNNLVASRLISKEDASILFLKLDWPLQRRAQELEISEWENLAANINFGGEPLKEKDE